jgi:phosphoribosylaminoimidazole-succinocarboxamide synthase
MHDGPRAVRGPSAVLDISDDLPLRVARPVHSGKVRSVYFLGAADSRRLIESRGYAIAPESTLAIMVISDRLSAFDCLWHTPNLAGVPGKGAALNAIAAHWFSAFAESGLPPHHLLEMPHPMLWVVRQARPVMIEAIARRHLTGSLWRAYARGERSIGGVEVPDGLAQYARLPELLFTPSTKGVVRGVPGVAEVDDAPLPPAALRAHFEAFGLQAERQVDDCIAALRGGFRCIEDRLGRDGEILVDTKFEFGLAPARDGGDELIYMDEVGTPDSSRIWSQQDWQRGAPREHSKEQFREALLQWVPDAQLLLDPARMDERAAFARSHPVPEAFFESLAATYRQQAESILGRNLELPAQPRESLLDVLSQQFDLVL